MTWVQMPGHPVLEGKIIAERIRAENKADQDQPHDLKFFFLLPHHQEFPLLFECGTHRYWVARAWVQPS